MPLRRPWIGVTASDRLKLTDSQGIFERHRVQLGEGKCSRREKACQVDRMMRFIARHIQHREDREAPASAPISRTLSAGAAHCSSSARPAGSRKRHQCLGVIHDIERVGVRSSSRPSNGLK